MLEMCKNILKSVSIDKALFSKELKKSITWIKESEIGQLKDWCLQEFGDKYEEVISIIFSNYKLA